MDQVLKCPSCHHTDVDFARLTSNRVRCSLCRAVIEVDEHTLLALAPGGAIAELTGSLIDRKALLSSNLQGEKHGVRGDLVNSFPADFYVSDDGYLCIQNGSEVVTLSPDQGAELMSWMPRALELARQRYRPEPVEGLERES